VTRQISRQRAAALLVFLTDRDYYRELFKFALPIAMQSFATSLLNLVAGVMVGQLGDAPVAAVGLASQIFFLLQLTLFGITSGASIFTAQLWGKRDIYNIHRVQAFCLLLGIIPGLGFFLLSQFAPEWALGVYSTDPEVIQLGASYLRLYGWSFLLVVVTFSYIAVLRSVGNVILPLFITIGALVLNVSLSYVLIFGKLGFPPLGVQGAAIAGLISRVAECFAILWFSYRYVLPSAIRLVDFFRVDLPFAMKIIKPVLPVAFNEILWSLGITTYNIIYARIGTESIAAMNIALTIDSLAFVVFIGVGQACAIMVGNRIGAGDEERAYQYAGRSLILSILFGLVMGGMVFLGAPWLLSLYDVSKAVVFNAQRVLYIIASLMWLRASNFMLFIGVLRSGGDTRFAFVLDALIIWSLGVPMAYLGAFVFRFPVYLVYLMVMSEEFLKWLLALWRFRSRRWIHNLAQSV
jgi:putative MATE family efflux protein